MINYTVINPTTGEVIRTGAAPEDQVANQVGEGEELLEMMAPPFTFWNGSSFRPLPVQPSPSYQFNWTTKTWFDPRTLEDLKGIKWNEMKVARAAAEYLPITVGGNSFDADVVSQQKIAGAVQLATMAGDDWTIDWTTATNTVVELSKAEMIAIGVALGTRTSAIYSYARTLRTDIENAASIAELNGMGWSLA